MSASSGLLQRDSFQTTSMQSADLDRSVGSPSLQAASHLDRRSQKKKQRLRSSAVSQLSLTQDPGNVLGSAATVGTPAFSVNDQVNAIDRDDFYRFTASQSGVFTANLRGLAADADVRLIRDRNKNGAIDQNDVIAWQWERGATGESIRHFLSKGAYYVQVTSYNGQTTNYALTTSFTPAASDSRQFSIQVNFGQNLQTISTTARNAITAAAKFWEQVIPFSPFNTPLKLVIDADGIFRNDTVLAFAGPSQDQVNASGYDLAIAGDVTLNTRFSRTYNNNPDFLEQVMIHEFGHILGIGTFWETTQQDLIDRSTNTYRANTNAGWAYGELLGTFTQTPVPVEPYVFGHWDEDIFGTELMTPVAEAANVPTPLSQLTIASLRDIGWNVNYGAAQLYRLPTSNRTLTSSTSSLFTSNSNPQLRCGCATHLANSRVHSKIHSKIHSVGSVKLAKIIKHSGFIKP